MKKSILNFVGAVLMATGSLGLLTGLTGCATSSDTRALASLYRASAYSADSVEEARRFGQMAELLDMFGFMQASDERSRRQYQRQNIPEHVVFRDGKYFPEPGYVWLNPDDPKDLRVVKIQPRKEKKVPEPFFFNYYIDKNNDNQWSLDEFIGIKEVFRSDEPVRAVSFWKVVNGDLNGKRVTMDILGLDTNRVAYNFGIVEEDPDNVIRLHNGRWATHYLIPVEELKEKVGGSRFRVIWNLDGKPQKYADFTVIDAPEEGVDEEEAKKTEPQADEKTESTYVDTSLSLNELVGQRVRLRHERFGILEGVLEEEGQLYFIRGTDGETTYKTYFWEGEVKDVKVLGSY